SEKSATFRDHAFGGGAVPCAHFSLLPSTPQAVSPRKIGIVYGLSPAAGVSIASTWPRPLPGGTADRIGVIIAPRRPIALFLPWSRLPMVWPSAPLTWPSGGGVPAVPGDKIALSSSMV